MKRRSAFSFLAPLLALLVLAAALPCAAADEFDPDKFLKNEALKKELQKLQSDEQGQRAIMTHANKAFGVTNTLFDFAAKLAGGDFTEQIEIIMDTPVQQWNANRGMMGSYEIINVKRIAYQNQTSSLFGRLKGDMSNLALGLSIYGVMKDAYAGMNGDDTSKLKAVKGTYDLTQGYWASRVGWNSLGTAMLGVGVINYALDTFINTTIGDYSDTWWVQYSGYLETKYPNVVTGDNSWAALARSGGESAILARLDEFWAAPYQNLTGTSFIKSDYAEMQLAKGFAARYYSEYLHKTLKIYFTNEAEKAEALAWYEAQKAHAHMQQMLADLEMLRQAIADADKIEPEEEEEEEKAPVSLIIRPGSATIKVGESVTFTSWFVYEDHTVKTATARTTFSGDASGSSFTAAEPGTATITATCDGLHATATVTVEEAEADDDEEDEIDDAIDEIKDPEDEDTCEASGVAEMRGRLDSQIGRVQSLASVVEMYRTKFDKELADRASDPCGNSLAAYCYTQASDAAGDLESIVDEIRELAGSLLMQMALCPDAVDASGDPYSIRDVIKDIANAGTARAEARSALADMQSRLGDNGCDEEEFGDLADQFTEDGQDPDGMQDGADMAEVGGDGVDNDQDGLQEEDWSEVAGKNVTIVVYDSGSAKDDSFNLSVSGVGNLGLTPVGGLRTYGVDLGPGTYTATVTVVVAPDDCGTVTAIAVQNGVTIGSLGTGTSCPTVGTALTFSFTVAEQ